MIADDQHERTDEVDASTSPSACRSCHVWFSSTGITSEPKYVRTSGTDFTGVPSKRVTPSVPGIWFQPGR